MIKNNRELVAALVTDGWRLRCGCLYLFIRDEPTLTITTHATKREVCPRYHDAGLAREAADLEQVGR